MEVGEKGLEVGIWLCKVVEKVVDWEGISTAISEVLTACHGPIRNLARAKRFIRYKYHE